MGKYDKTEVLLWSIAFPGFGQILNGKYIKGALFIGLEFLVNVQSNFNEVIILSFHGDLQSAIDKTNYGWLMFYPCLYLFSIWDAYRDGGGGKTPYSYLPFVFAAYFATLGLIFSPGFKVFGVLLGPVWLPILSCFIGIGIGIVIKNVVLRWTGRKPVEQKGSGT
jgi:hypothetical protein